MVQHKPHPLLLALASCLIYLAGAPSVYAERYHGGTAALRIAVTQVCFDAGRGISACIPAQALAYQGSGALAPPVAGVHRGYREAPVGRGAFLSARSLKRSSCAAAAPTGGKGQALAFLRGGDAPDVLFEVNNFVVDMSADGSGIHVGYRDCWS